jgi:hypothetical protein
VLRRCSVVSWSRRVHRHVASWLCHVALWLCVVVCRGRMSHWLWHLDVQPQPVVRGRGWVFLETPDSDNVVRRHCQTTHCCVASTFLACLAW